MSNLYNPQLDTFLCVAEAGSFSKAAEKIAGHVEGLAHAIIDLNQNGDKLETYQGMSTASLNDCLSFA